MNLVLLSLLVLSVAAQWQLSPHIDYDELAKEDPKTAARYSWLFNRKRREAVLPALPEDDKQSNCDGEKDSAADPVKASYKSRARRFASIRKKYLLKN